MDFGAYGRLLQDPRIRHLLAVGFIARFPHTAAGVILTLHVALTLGLGYGQAGLAAAAMTLGIAVGERAPAADVRAAVLVLRASKGMVLDAGDHDTWSAGSFFTNPVLSADEAAALPAGAPCYPQPDGRVKTSAAWLIDAAGYGRGYGHGPARLSEKHSLALTNRGTAKASDVLDLAREVRAGVRAMFGVTLVPEPVLVGCEL